MAKASSHHCSAQIRIAGMHCRSCELILERALNNIPGIVAVDADASVGTVRITARADALPAESAIVAVIAKAGYRLCSDGESLQHCRSSCESPHRKWMEIAGALILVVAGSKILQMLDIVSLAPSTSGALTLGGVLLIGLVAGTSSCLAVTGGLLVGMAARHHARTRQQTSGQRLRPLLAFNAGRLASYAVLGGLTGLLGQAITLSTTMTGYANIVVAVVMAWMGLRILEIIPTISCPIRPPKCLSRWIAGLSSDRESRIGPFALGGLTYFLPCGFTQSLQLVALASGSFAIGAITMFTFALGTLPSLLGLSLVSSTARGNTSRLFLRFAGALVVLLAFFNVQSGLVLAGIPLPRFLAGSTDGSVDALVQNGAQEISMRITPNGYEPDTFTVRAGQPVRWTVDGTNAGGCTSVLVIPDLDIVRPLSRGPNVIEFTPTQPGPLSFSCSMGMVRGNIIVL